MPTGEAWRSMSKQTLPESTKKAKEAPSRHAPPARPAKGRPYRRQTARVEERRDGKPLIFGWGKHLSRRQKTTIQKRAFWTFVTVAVLAVVSVLGYSYYNVNYRIPNQPIVTVNGHPIPQSLFRKMNFYLAQDLSNQLAALQQQQQAAKNKADSSDQATHLEGEKELAELEPKQQALQAQFAIPTVGSTSVTDLEDDVLIQEQIPILEAHGVPASRLEASDQEITARLNAFKKAFPPSVTYQQFLSAGKMSEDELRQLLAVVIRHDKMDKYQQSLVGPTVPQVHASELIANSKQEADKFLAQLKSAEDLPATFTKLAKTKSHDTDEHKKAGGDLGWVAYGDTATGVNAEKWLFDPARKIGDLSPAIDIGGGQYKIFYITAIDPHRPVSSDQLNTLRGAAYTHWRSQILSSPQTTVTDVDTTMELDPNNFPPNLPSGAVNPTPGTGGLPGGSTGP